MKKLFLAILLLVLLLTGITALQWYLPVLTHQGSVIDQFTTENGQKVRIVSEESVVIDVYKKATPSVVTVAAKANGTKDDLSNDIDPFFFFDIPTPQQAIPSEPQNIGSGFIVDKNGLIITNKHVVDDREVTYTVLTSDGKQYEVEKIYRDPLNDIALVKIKVNGANLTPVTLGDSETLQVGQLAIAIGTPLGEFTNTITTGVISGVGRGITAGSVFQGFVEELDNVIQTDAAINPGNSGGPLLNSKAEVIGVNTAVSQSGQNIGFALPINTIKEAINTFNKTGSFNRPYLGVSYKVLSAELAKQNELVQGAYVQTVIEGSAAQKAGVKDGDVITKIDGQAIQPNRGELSNYIAKRKVGDSITLTLFRDGKTLEVKAILEAAPEE